MGKQEYESPLARRYASREMSYIFSQEFRFRTWRKLWVILAQEEKALGLKISTEQIAELEKFQDSINYERAEEFEKKYQHEVMSHIHAYGEQCPKARGIIHLGATSAYVLDNTDLIQIKAALTIINKRLLGIIKTLRDFSLTHKELTTLSYTHYQVAQPSTVGKRGSLWLQEILYDYEDSENLLKRLPFRGVKGTTGTQNSFLKIFGGDAEKVFKLDQAITERMGFAKVIGVTSQTYSRKIDYWVLSHLSGIAQSAHKFSNDIRLLQNHKEIEEPFWEEQIGSSAMPYKRNPMRSERIASLSRYTITMTQNAAHTAANQWLERSLDDSANKRLSIAEAFLTTDGILKLYQHIIGGLQVHPQRIRANLKKELPFMTSEDILMEAVKKGADRQKVHAIIRRSAFEAMKQMEENPEAENPLIEILANEKDLLLSITELRMILERQDLAGLSGLQVDKFIKEEIDPILHKASKSTRAERTK